MTHVFRLPFAPRHPGYFAGTGEGIVTVGGQPAQRRLIVLTADGYFDIVTSAISASSGHYIVWGLDPDKEYILMARDHRKHYEPVVYDWIRPAVGGHSVQALINLWATWQ